MHQPKEAVLSRQEAAQYLHVCLTTFDKLDIPRVKVRRKVLFRLESLEKWLTDHEKTGGNA
jgi:excisionase family DNA binding protein